MTKMEEILRSLLKVKRKKKKVIQKNNQTTKIHQIKIKKPKKKDHFQENCDN